MLFRSSVLKSFLISFVNLGHMRKKQLFCILLATIFIIPACERVEWITVQQETNSKPSSDEPADSTENVVVDDGGEEEEEPRRPGLLEGNGSFLTPYSVQLILENDSIVGTSVWTEGYVVGYTAYSIKNAVFDYVDAGQSNLLLADSPTENNWLHCLPVELKSAVIQKAISLRHHPAGYKQKVVLYGKIDTYFSVRGIRGVSDYEWYVSDE